MTALIAQPGDTFVGIAILVGIVIWCLVAAVRKGNEQVDAALDRCLECEAADHGEPSRAQVEAEWTPEALERVLFATENPWLFEAQEFSDTPIHDALAVEKLRCELDNPAAVVLWLGDAS